MMNDLQFVKATKQLREKIIRNNTSIDHELPSGCCGQLSYPPRETAVDKSVAIEEMLMHYTTNVEAASALVKIGNSEPDARLNASELAVVSSLKPYYSRDEYRRRPR